MVDYVDLKELLPSMLDTLNSGGSVTFTVAGNSMLPMLKTHSDSVTLIKPFSNLKKYDVALFSREDESLVLHRVVKFENNEYIMRGDNCSYSETVKPERVIAVVTDFTHKGSKKSVELISYKIYCFLWCNAFSFFIRKKLIPKAKSAIKRIIKK